LKLNLSTPLQKLDYFPNLNVSIKRDDLIHPVVAGNKWRKLAGYVDQLPANAHVITFGGAHSNHLAAAATVLTEHRHTGTFIIRGEELTPDSSDVLRHCQQLGIRLVFIPRTEFRDLRDHQWQPNPDQRARWQMPANGHILPEGGSGEHNRQGCAQLWQELQQQGTVDQLWLAAGTGGTARGILHAMPVDYPTQVHIISAVKGAKREAKQTLDLASSKGIQCTWQDENVFGGFAKSSPELAHLHNLFSHATDIPLDPVYNTKVCWHLQQLSLSKPSTSDRIVWLHTGGFGLNNPTAGT
jgi:1-aminocyclopropane-1-carboxylate deaminase